MFAKTLANDGIQRVDGSKHFEEDIVIRASEAGVALGTKCWWCASKRLKWYGKTRGVIECLDCGAMTGEGEKSAVVRKFNKRMDSLRIGEEAALRSKEGRGWFAPTMRQLECLQFLAEMGRINLRKCSEAMKISPSGARRMALILEEKGFLNRVHNCPAEGAFEVSQNGLLALQQAKVRGTGL